MPLYAAKPVKVEARAYLGHTANLDGAFGAAVLRHSPGAAALIRTEWGNVTIRPGDWLVQDGRGEVAPMKAAAFERLFSEHVPTADAPPASPAPDAERVKRAYTRRTPEHAG